MIYVKIYDNHKDVVSKLLNIVFTQSYYVGFDKRDMIPITFETHSFSSCKTDTEKLVYSVKYIKNDPEEGLNDEGLLAHYFLDYLDNRKLYVGYKITDKDFLDAVSAKMSDLKLLNL